MKPAPYLIEKKSGGNHSGVTLVELVVVVSIVSILAAVAAPSFSQFIRKIRINSLSGTVVSSLQLARSEAIKANQRVLVCARNSAGTDCAASTTWGTTGWIVCHDENADNACDASTTTRPNPIRVDRAINSAHASITGPSSAIRFNPTGSQGGAGASTVTITITGTWTGATGLDITVAPTGLIKGNRL